MKKIIRQGDEFQWTLKKKRNQKDDFN